MYQRKTRDRWDIMTNYGCGAVRLEKHREKISE